MEKRIVDCIIYNENPILMVVRALFDDDSNEILFRFYSDEVYFHSSEFIGLTKKEALEVCDSRDYQPLLWKL